jgi:hypothetical protein
MMLTQLATIARKTGCPVVEVPGWKTRTTKDERKRPREMSDIRTITCHHTANGGAKGNYPSLRVVRDGRTGLQGPLAHYGIGLDGTIYVIAAGNCNHAGVSSSADYTNSHAIGIEAEAVGVPGTKGDWPPKQMDAYVRLCRALVEAFPGVSVSDVRGHKETCAPAGRKSDPDFNMTAFRIRVAAMDLTPPAEDIVASKDELRALLIKLIEEERLVPNKPLDAGAAQGRNWTLSEVLAAGDQKLDLVRREQTRQAGVQTAQDEALAGINSALAGKATAASVAQLSQKVDTLIGLLKPKAQ